MCRTIAIAGISSKLARDAAAELLKQPDVRLRGSCRDIDKLPDFLKGSSRVTLVQSGAYDSNALRSLIQGCDVVACCYFADDETMLEGQKLLIDLCEEEGVPRYIASDYTADYTKLDLGDLVIKDPMKHVKDYLDAKAKVKGVHILVGLMMETFWAYFDVWNPDKKTIRYWGTGKEEWDLTTYHTTAQYLAAVALDPQAVGIKKFVGHRTTLPEIAEDVQHVLGLTPMLENAGSLQDVYKRINAGNSVQDPIAAGSYYMLTGKISLGSDLDNSRYPDITPETFRDVLKKSSNVA